MKFDEYPIHIKGLFGVAGALFVAALAVYGNTMPANISSGEVTSQGASLSWINNQTGLETGSPGPSREVCSYNNNQDSAKICVQGNQQNIYGTFSVNEQREPTVGAASYFRTLTNSDADHLGWRVLWKVPQITINGTPKSYTTATGANAFVTSTFVDRGPGNVSFSLGGGVYTAGNTQTDQNKNRDEIEKGLVQLVTSAGTVRGGGITVAAGTPLQMEWHCQAYQLQYFGAWCNPAVGIAQRDCTTGRKIDGFNASDTSASSAVYLTDTNTLFSNVTGRASSAPRPFTVYKDTTLNLRCVNPGNSGQKRLDGIYDAEEKKFIGNPLIAWTMAARNSPVMSLEIDAVNQIGVHNIAANPTATTVGNKSAISWKAAWAQRCRVTGTDGFDSGWKYGSGCNATTTAQTASFTAPGSYTYTLTYAIFDANGVETLNSNDKIIVTVSCGTGQTLQDGMCIPDVTCPSGQFWNGVQCLSNPVDLCTNIEGNQATWPAPGVRSGTTCSCESGYALSGEQCVENAPTPAAIDDFTANPLRVRAGNQTTLEWTITSFPAEGCSISGTNGFGYAVTGTAGQTVTGSAPSNQIQQTTIFTLSCGGGASAQRTVTVIPSFEEI